MSIRLEEFVETHLSALEVLGKRWVQRPDFTKARFVQFAELYYINYPGYYAINWVDPKGVIRWVYPEEPNLKAIGMDIHNHPNPKCRESFARVEKTRKYGITPCMELFQGGQGFAVDWPLIHNETLQGYLNGVFLVKPLIETCLARGVFEDFLVAIYEGENLIFQYVIADEENEDAILFVEKEVHLREKTWQLKVWPKPKIMHDVSLVAHLPLLLFGLLVSITMGLLIHFLIREVDLYRQALNECARSQNSLVESENRYRTMIENANDMIWMLDTQGKMTFFNRQSEIVSGHKFEDWKGKTFAPLIYPDDLGVVNEVFQKTLSGEPQQYRVRVTTKNGDTVVLSINTAPMYDGNKIVGTVSFGRDITARVQAEKKLQESLERYKKIIEGIVHAMARAVEMKDPYTAGHQRRVAKLACAIAQEMGFEKKQIEGIRIAAMLHDIGKILTPSEILNKPCSLTDTEMREIKIHPEIAFNILKSIDFDWPIADIIYQHHERIDKSGYPSRLDGEEIMLEAKIVAVSDVVEAMCSARPYRPAYSIEKALQEIEKNTGVLYDVDVVKICIILFTKKNFSFD